MERNDLILPASVVVAAVIIVAGMVFLTPGLPEGQGQVLVQLPNYLEKSSSSVSEGATPDYGGEVISFAEDESGNRVRLVSVSGTVSKTASPEIAYVTLSVETLDKSATKSQSDNAVLANKVMSALEASGLSKDDIETSSYNVREEFEWNESTRKSVSVGYRTTNTITATVKDLASVGSVIDAAVEAGANSVSGVTFALTKQTQSELKTMALKEAAENALEKAQSVASGLGISVGQVYSASESSSYSTPYYAKSYSMDAVAGESVAPTPITPGDIEFSATVSVQFEIQ